MASHSSPKAGHYETSLTAALLKGYWADASPGSAPNGTLLSWSELIRKWGKHTGSSEYFCFTPFGLFAVGRAIHEGYAMGIRCGVKSVLKLNTCGHFSVDPLILEAQLLVV